LTLIWKPYETEKTQCQGTLVAYVLEYGKINAEHERDFSGYNFPFPMRKYIAAK